MTWITDSNDRDTFEKAIPRKESSLVIAGGGDIIEGIGLSILNDIRNFSSAMQNRVLSLRSPDDINNLVNSHFRPQILLPSSITLKNGTFDIKWLTGKKVVNYKWNGAI